MRELMSKRLAAAKPDRQTILQFIEWLAACHNGRLTILLPSGSCQDVDVDAELDTFHGIDRTRLACEKPLYGTPETPA